MEKDSEGAATKGLNLKLRNKKGANQKKIKSVSNRKKAQNSKRRVGLGSVPTQTTSQKSENMVPT